jgi:acyl-CoA hydrolase
MREREITLRLVAETIDVNLFGNVHGGSVMKWIDQAAYACAVGWSSLAAVTVYVSGIRFYKPIHIGDIVELRARLIYTGRTSMHIAVDVNATEPRAWKKVQTTHCVVVFVALDDAANPTPVPPYEPQTDEDRAMHDYAMRLMELRQGIEAEMAAHINPDDGGERA